MEEAEHFIEDHDDELTVESAGYDLRTSQQQIQMAVPDPLDPNDV